MEIYDSAAEGEYPAPDHPIRHITVRGVDRLNYVSVAVRIDTRSGPRKALMLLARAAVEVCVLARKTSHADALAKGATHG